MSGNSMPAVRTRLNSGALRVLSLLSLDTTSLVQASCDTVRLILSGVCGLGELSGLEDNLLALGSVSVGSSSAGPNSRASWPTPTAKDVLGAGDPGVTDCLPPLLLGAGSGGVLVDIGLTGLLCGGVGRGLTPDALSALPALVVVPDNSCRT